MEMGVLLGAPTFWERDTAGGLALTASAIMTTSPLTIPWSLKRSEDPPPGGCFILIVVCVRLLSKPKRAQALVQLLIRARGRHACSTSQLNTTSL